MYGPVYRHLLLPLFDRVLKGRQTLKYWREAEERQWWSPAELQAFQFAQLQRLVNTAEGNCPYYAQAWQERGLSVGQLQSPDDFARWPLITRDTIREHRMTMRNQQPLKLISKGTGGSSGQPLQFDVSAESHERRTALMYRGYGWAGGAPGTRQLYLWGGPLHMASRWARLKNQAHHAFDRHTIINCFEMTPDRMPGHVATLQKCRPDVIVAYTNPLYEFARYLDEQHIQPWQPRSLIIGAEKIYPHQRELIERVFRAPVFETYGSREFMLIGAECEHHNGLHLSVDNLLVEILDEDGQPTPAGQVGQVVITDLFNLGMPFIRYVNGDRALAGSEICPCGRGLPLLKGVAGRQLDLLTTPDGRTVPGEFFPHLLKEFSAIRRFQVLQSTPDCITLKLVAPDLSLADQELLLLAIRATVGEVVELRLQRVTEIPLTAAGKHRVVVRELSPTGAAVQDSAQPPHPLRPVH